jgi:hypothetical protein
MGMVMDIHDTTIVVDLVRSVSAIRDFSGQATMSRVKCDGLSAVMLAISVNFDHYRLPPPPRRRLQ